MLVHIKGASFLIPDELPQLTIMLSCWDEYKAAHLEISEPDNALKGKMPLFHAFLRANWLKTKLNIIGLSSTGRKLDEKKPDEDYLDNGPENFGYWIHENGLEDIDLTGIISLIYHD